MLCEEAVLKAIGVNALYLMPEINLIKAMHLI